MSPQSIVAVVLPAGIRSGGLAANVYLSPRLSGGARLSDFPDWLDWTGRIQRHGLSVVLEGPGGSASVAVDPSHLRPDVWGAVFRPDSPVDPHTQGDFGERVLVSYPSRAVHRFLRWAYQYAGFVPLSSPELADRVFSLLLSDLVFRDGTSSTLDTTLSHLRVAMWHDQQGETPTVAPSESPKSPLDKPAGTADMVQRFALYHHLPPAPGRAPLPSRPAELERLVDFHRALTALSGYPPLLPLLGLVLPIMLPDTLCPASPAAGAYLRVKVASVEPGWTWAQDPTLATPSTAYVRDAHGFSAAPASSPAALTARTYEPADVVDGFLALTPAHFELVGFDGDGALLKLMALADSLALTGDPSLADGLLPALRSGGLALHADGRASELLRAIRDNRGFEAVLSGGAVRPLTARDVTRGYRLDIWSDVGGRWESLHRRDGTYAMGVDGSIVVRTEDEEGYVQLAAVQPADDPTRADDTVAEAAGVPQPGTDLYVNERIARWHGWSLSAPRPGTPLNRSPDPALATQPDTTAGQPVTAFKLVSSFVAHPGSLPSLRFGRRYRVRARAVDLAGASLSLDAPAVDELTMPSGDDTQPYYRYEPVDPPTVVLRTLPGPGASLLELVIRSYNSDPSLDAAPTDDTDERHVVAPKSAVLMVEHHGMLDDATGHLRADAAAYDLVTTRDRGALPTLDGVPLDPAARLTVPYLPDPIARGAVFADLPQTEADTDGTISGGALHYAQAAGATPRPGSVTWIPYGSSWPDREPFRIRLVEGSRAPVWDDPDRVLTVSLAKGQRWEGKLSSYATAADLELLGVWNWLRELFEELEKTDLTETDAGPMLVSLAAARNRLTQLSLDGANPLLTPQLTLALTHAVQQPLGIPTWASLPIVHDPGSPVAAATLANAFSPVTAWRSVGSHHAVLLGALRINGATTAALDLEARWIEPVDDLDEPGPTIVRGSTQVERINLPTLLEGPVAADGSGTRQVAVYVPSIDTLWFAAPFDELSGVSSPPDVAAPVHQLGDTKHRVVRYRAVASSRFEEYFPEPGTPTSRAGPGLTVDVPSSARPEPPDVVYVVPTFGWDDQVTTNTKTNIRAGNGLRVYLRRPWYSSGSAELLGVTLWPGSAPAPSDDQREAAKAFVTQWGLDPVWASGDLVEVPGAHDFPAAVRVGTGLTLEGTTQTVDVAGHAVAYDAERQLWFCDVVFDNPTAYMPFVRLALARYQPRSIAGTELSAVVLSDFVQPVPDRSAALTIDPSAPTKAKLVVAGLAPAGPNRSYVTASVEQRRTDVLSDLGWEAAPAMRATVVEASPAPSEAGSVLYAAAIHLSGSPQPGELRVVVREFELLRVDPPGASGPQLASRLVYAAVIPLDFPSSPDSGGGS